MSVLDELITDRLPGAKYGVTDVNRINEAIDYLAEWLGRLGVRVIVSPSAYTRDDLPTEGMFDAINRDITRLISAVRSFVTGSIRIPDCGSSKPWVSTRDANDYEKALLKIREGCIAIEGERAWNIRTEDDGNVYAFYSGSTEPPIGYRLAANGNLYATYPSGSIAPDIRMDSSGNIYLETEES